MTPERDPWNRQQGGSPGGGGFHGPWLWLLLVAGLGALVWVLLEIFPQRQLGQADWVQLVKLSAIVVVCSSGLLFLRRVPLRETLRNAAIWAGIAGVLLIGYSYRDDFSNVGARLSGELLPSQAVDLGAGEVEIRAGRDGHFTVTAEVNGQPVDFLVDTGASDIVLSPGDARRLGYDPAQLSFTRYYNTANGLGRGAPVRLDSLAVGPIVFNDLPASVNEAPMGESLLGMTFLRQLDSYEVRRDRLILRR
ncbi:retropepsin-like aspartic protease family protein [Pelagibius marinus]|uniref:retropepsin-like aspartic protease family protein n=1 Tax=Pelagibius marinus TaxID=2762760 RepID=UPI00187263E2|nr:TIGR02281 family clan AA aspartic protease [Pelagibius marinus]